VSYVPTGKVRPVVEAMAEDPGRLWTSAEIAEAMGVAPATVSAYTEYPLRHQVMFRGTRRGVTVYAGKPIPIEAPAPAFQAYVPPQMKAPRLGSEQPRKGANPPPPTPRHRPPGMCAGCERPLCWDKGCIAASLPAAAAKAPAVASPPITPAPTPIPTPAPIEALKAMPTTEMTTPAPPPTTALDIPKFGAAPPAPAQRRPSEGLAGGAAPEFDAWISARTGNIRLIGATIDADGTVTLKPDQMALLREQLAHLRDRIA